MEPSYKLEIRAATEDDVDMLQQLSITTFLDTYEEYNSTQDMQLYIAEHFNHAFLLSQLNSGGCFFLSGNT